MLEIDFARRTYCVDGLEWLATHFTAGKVSLGHGKCGMRVVVSFVASKRGRCIADAVLVGKVVLGRLHHTIFQRHQAGPATERSGFGKEGASGLGTGRR